LRASTNFFLLVRNLTADFESSTIHPVVSDLEDVQDLSNLEAQLPQKLDAVIHLAQSYRFREFPAGAMSVTNVNVVATAHLLESAARKGVQHFICASTGGVYAEQPGQRAIC
jgi:UDP-glucose 4-epimerase